MNAIVLALLGSGFAMGADAAKAPDTTPSIKPLHTSVVRITQRPYFLPLMLTPTFQTHLRTPSWPVRSPVVRFTGHIPSQRFHTDYSRPPRFSVRWRTASFKPRVDRMPTFTVSPSNIHFRATYPATRFRVIPVAPYRPRSGG